jgi:hypothetical protein
MCSRGGKSGERQITLLKRKRGVDCIKIRHLVFRLSKGKKEKNSTAAHSPRSSSFSLHHSPPNHHHFLPTLTAIVLQHPHALEAAAREWADRYQASTQHRARATAELLSLLVAAVGGEVAEVTRSATSESTSPSSTSSAETATSHGLLEPFGGGKGGGAGGGSRLSRERRSSYSRMWSLLVGEIAARGLLGDSYAIEKTIKLVLGLTW